eukprot:gene4390-5137_t
MTSSSSSFSELHSNKLFGNNHGASSARGTTPMVMSSQIKNKIFDQENFVGRDSVPQYHGESRSFKVLEVDQNGNLIDQIIFKNNLSIEMKLQARDLRTIDSSFPPQMPAILARDKVFILSIGFVRAIVQHNKIIFFDPQNPFIRNDLVSIMKDYLGNQNLFFMETLTLPFEFKVLEAILVFIVTVEEITDALNKVLQSDEDMALMYLSFRNVTGTTRKKNQHEELEILLENYMRQLEQISNEISQLKETVTSTEEFVNFQLDTARNKMMRMTLMLSLVTISTGMGSMVTGIFGMNLLNGLELHPNSFMIVCGSVVAGGLSIFGLIKYYCHYNNILPYSKKQKFKLGGITQHDSFQNPLLQVPSNSGLGSYKDFDRQAQFMSINPSKSMFTGQKMNNNRDNNSRGEPKRFRRLFKKSWGK